MGSIQVVGDRFGIIVVVQVEEGIWPKIAHSAVERSPPPCHCHPASNLSAKIGSGGFLPDNSKVRTLLYTLWARERESTTTTTK
jgi:hypothetical protein